MNPVILSLFLSACGGMVGQKQKRVLPRITIRVT